ncbi:hypothetical protein NDU88_005888 [Pleurodeles waltl]|uniref:Uncharacterized protein n=1 Tax=Pleurodeles waltl TaxID=8319 RepID=A0AAV7VMJ9_PLEWA|nr:hypothetical protein NDU88_005888 [Pleurodeles waltl]
MWNSGAAAKAWGDVPARPGRLMARHEQPWAVARSGLAEGHTQNTAPAARGRVARADLPAGGPEVLEEPPAPIVRGTEVGARERGDDMAARARLDEPACPDRLIARVRIPRAATPLN